MKTLIPKIATLVFAVSASFLQADPLVKWNFGGEDGTQERMAPLAGSVASQLEVSPITRGAGFPAGTGTPFTENSMTFWMIPGINTAEDAVEKGAYFEITLTPKDGSMLSIQSVSFATKRASKLSGPNKFIVRSSVDGFGSDIAGPDETQSVPIPEGADISISLGGSLDNLTKPVTLRFYGYGRNKADNADGGIWCIMNSSAASGFAIDGTITAKP